VRRIEEYMSKNQKTRHQFWSKHSCLPALWSKHSCLLSLTLAYIFIFSTVSICLKFTGVKKRNSGEINYLQTRLLIRIDSTASSLWRRITAMQCVIKLFFCQMNKYILPNKHSGGQIRNSICVSI